MIFSVLVQQSGLIEFPEDLIIVPFMWELVLMSVKHNLKVLVYKISDILFQHD